MVQMCRVRSGIAATAPGSTTFGAIGVNVQPVSRVIVMRSMLTVSVSPGSAPVTKNGPVIGFGRDATVLPCRSIPHASTVCAITVSPSAMVSAGSAVPRVLW